MAINFYVKYYPRNYDSYPNNLFNPTWYLSGVDSKLHNDNYNQGVTAIKIYCIPAYKVWNTEYLDYNTNYNSSLGSFSLSAQATSLRWNTSSFPAGSLYLSGWTANTFNWSPTDIPVFRDNCITFINNNNATSLNSEDINLDLWLYQNISGNTCHIPVFYRGNNPAADYMVTI